MGRIVRLALHHEEGMAGRMRCCGVAYEYVINVGQIIVLGQNQQACRHPLARGIEASAVLGIQLRYALADLLIERVIGMTGLHWIAFRQSGRRRRYMLREVALLI